MQDNYLFTDYEFQNARSTDKLPMVCIVCGQLFSKEKRIITRPEMKNQYCSAACCSSTKETKSEIQCCVCGKTRIKSKTDQLKTKNNFCSHSCSAIYNNTHKTTGTRRSKLEQWLETKLTALFPDLEIHFNRKDVINSELDIYIPSLKLAFELNGIFHYEPIYGPEKLASIQNNDNRKFQACAEAGISLCIIDISGQKYFKTTTSEKYLNIITKIIKS